MEHRFTAGEIAKLSGLSKQTILFYDKKGILKPDYVDPDNGYRTTARTSWIFSTIFPC